MDLVSKINKLKYRLRKKINREHTLKAIAKDRDVHGVKLEAELKHVRSRLHQFTRLKIPKRTNPKAWSSLSCRTPSANRGCTAMETATETEYEPNRSLSSSSDCSSSDSE